MKLTDTITSILKPAAVGAVLLVAGSVQQVHAGAACCSHAKKSASIQLNAINDFTSTSISGFVPAYKDKGRKALAVNAGKYKNKFAAAQSNFSGATGQYNITITTMTEIDGESTYRLKIGDSLVGEFQNPETKNDFSSHKYTFKNVSVKQNDIVQVEFNSASNDKIPEGNGFAFARGRWSEITFTPNK